MEVFPYTDGTDTALLRAYDRKTDIDSDGLHYKFELRDGGKARRCCKDADPEHRSEGG